MAVPSPDLPMQAWGRGVEKITDACREREKPEPYYRARANEVMIGFNTDVSIVENIVENNDISTIQMKIIELMLGNPRISAKAIADEIGIAPRNVQAHIQYLKAIGLVNRTGPAKGGRWIVRETAT